MNLIRTAARLAAAASLVVLVACGKGNTIESDLKALNAAGEAAMTAANAQQLMQKVQGAKTNEERAALMRETATAFATAQAELKKPEMKSDEVRAIQARMVGGFEKSGTGAKTVADAFEKSAAEDLQKGQALLREGQADFQAAGSEMVKLAREHKVSLTKK